MLSSPSVLTLPASDVIGISANPARHELLATQALEGISLYDARTQARLKSWRTSAGVQLTHPACVHPSTGRLIGVRDHSVVFAWDAERPITPAQATVRLSKR